MTLRQEIPNQGYRQELPLRLYPLNGFALFAGRRKRNLSQAETLLYTLK
jgi:hypothetical protein